MEYYDTHCHAHDTLEDCVCMEDIEITRMALMGVHPKNWKDELFVYEKSPCNIILGFGVHPWFTHEIVKQHDDSGDGLKLDEEERQEQWFIKLRSLLEEHPNSFVGEIGLDKKAKSQGEPNCA